MPDETKPAPGETIAGPSETTEPGASFTADRNDPLSLEQVFEDPAVKAITPTRDQPAPSARGAAVHDGVLWGGPQWITNAQAEPVYVRTKAEYWELLRRNGIRMRDQQESSTGPAEGPPRPPTVQIHETPHPPVAPMTKHEAEVFGAITAVFRRYAIVESLWCTHCFARNVPHGCRMKVNARGVVLECRGGVAGWMTPVGERNMLLQTIATTTSSRVFDRAPGTVLTPAGPVFRPARLLLPEEVLICREYFKALRIRGVDPRWHHRDCWSGNPWLEDDAMAVFVDDTQLIAVCQCRQLYASSAHPTPPITH